MSRFSQPLTIEEKIESLKRQIKMAKKDFAKSEDEDEVKNNKDFMAYLKADLAKLKMEHQRELEMEAALKQMREDKDGKGGRKSRKSKQSRKSRKSRKA